MIGKLTDDVLIQTVCTNFMDLLNVNPNDYEASTIEQIIKCVITVDEFKSSIEKLIQNTGNNIFTLWRNMEFFQKA